MSSIPTPSPRGKETSTASEGTFASPRDGGQWQQNHRSPAQATATGASEGLRWQRLPQKLPL